MCGNAYLRIRKGIMTFKLYRPLYTYSDIRISFLLKFCFVHQIRTVYIIVTFCLPYNWSIRIKSVMFHHIYICSYQSLRYNAVASSVICFLITSPLHLVENIYLCCFVVVLRFYGPVNPMGSCRARSVYLTTRLLGRLSPPSG